MPPSNVSSACYANLSQADEERLNWTLIWVAGREFYRSYGEAWMTKWDVLAKATPVAHGLAMTDGNPLLDEVLADVVRGIFGYVPGWDDSNCKLRLPEYACWAAAFVKLPNVLRMETAKAMEAGSLPPTMQASALAVACPSAIKQDPAYQATAPALPGCPAGQFPNPTRNNACETPSTCPEGESFDYQSWYCRKPGTTQVKLDEKTPASTYNWKLWLGLGAVVLGGAALVGALRAPEQVLASNPTSELDEVASRELLLYANNDGELYDRLKLPIIRNLLKKMKKGTYNPSLAPKAWLPLLEQAAKRYSKDYSDGSDWSRIFSAATRRHAAQEMAVEEETRMRNGEYDFVLKS